MHAQAKALAQRKPKCYELWPENEIPFSVFAALESQWRIISDMGTVIYQGIDYDSAKAAMEMMGIRRRQWPEVFEDLRLMERVAKKIFNDKDA
ncbi:hypothetical protein GTP44_00985 [Duganella sp. FT50W]|uniref:Uncharacterized protein n=1 Tax=Duganella lactea TaxID=2692173 RepID=A0A6L8MDQ1_9BURK|nr:DUF1799 domain-containing protein [Duganella lactea]MYM80534.1 hypothetical protein [Duganella lactea]